MQLYSYSYLYIFQAIDLTMEMLAKVSVHKRKVERDEVTSQKLEDIHILNMHAVISGLLIMEKKLRHVLLFIQQTLKMLLAVLLPIQILIIMEIMMDIKIMLSTAMNICC